MNLRESPQLRRSIYHNSSPGAGLYGSRRNDINRKCDLNRDKNKLHDTRILPIATASFYKPASQIGKKLADIKNVSSEPFKKEAIRTVIKYLAFAGYPYPLSAQDLRSPNRSTLVDIWGFLFKQLDPCIRISTENDIDEIPKLYKDLGYPVTITKSAMQTPGASHQWPHNLAALAWLCELFAYESESFPNYLNSEQMIDNIIPSAANEDMDMGNEEIDKIIDKIVIDRFCNNESDENHFNHNTEKTTLDEALDNKIKQFQEKTVNLEKEIESISFSLTEKQQIIRDHEARKKSNSVLRDQVLNLQKISSKDTVELPKKERLAAMTMSRVQEAMKKKGEFARSVMELQKKIDLQGITIEEKQKTMDEIYNYNKQINENKKKKDANAKEIYNYENTLIDQREKMLKRIDQINKLINTAKDLASVAQTSVVMDWKDIPAISLNLKSSPIKIDHDIVDAEMDRVQAQDEVEQSKEINARFKILSVEWNSYINQIKAVIERESLEKHNREQHLIKCKHDTEILNEKKNQHNSRINTLNQDYRQQLSKIETININTSESIQTFKIKINSLKKNTDEETKQQESYLLSIRTKLSEEIDLEKQETVKIQRSLMCQWSRFLEACESIKETKKMVIGNLRELFEIKENAANEFEATQKKVCNEIKQVMEEL